jgi:hypothetical protein
MPKFHSSSASADTALLRAVENMADGSLRALFERPAQNGAVNDLTAQLTNGHYSPVIEALKAPLQGLERREGLLIQSALTLALKSQPDFVVFPTVRIAVTDSDRKLVTTNRHADLGSLGAPEAGHEVGRVEIDLAVVNPALSLLQLVDIKRVPRATDKNRSDLMEAGLALKRRLTREGLNFNSTQIVQLRWFSGPYEAMGGGLDTCETIDETLGVRVRHVVETAIRRFRAGVDQKICAHVSRCLSMQTPKESAERKPPSVSARPRMAGPEVCSAPGGYIGIVAVDAAA